MVFRAIGLMSGTSLDGLDLCFAEFRKHDGIWNFEIIAAETLSYPEILETQLRNAPLLKSDELSALHSEYGFYLGEQTRLFIQKYHLEAVDLIASHGHTVFHQPEKKFTLQIGDGRAIKIINKIPVVYDFRSQDVLMGGNGAPLVPIGDELLFPAFDGCLNIGGFSNISYKADGKRKAFDICPVNIVLNKFAKILGKDFDENGEFARSGTVNEAVFNSLNELSFYQISSPKSLGSEWVESEIMPALKGLKAIDALATFTEHAAFQIANIFNKFHLKEVLFTGGGTYNSYLLERINHFSKTKIFVPNAQLIDFKEALIFAFMGVLRLNNEINVLSSATGSCEDHCSGILI